MSQLNISISSNIAAYGLPSSTAGGVPNSNGIVFSPNSISQPILNIPFSQQSTQPIINTPPQSVSGANNSIDFGQNYSPFNLPSAQLQQKTEKPQSSFSSSGFTFAPLVAASSLSMNQQTNISTINHANQHNSGGMHMKPTSSPTTDHVPFRTSNKCGISKYTTLRVVGGAITQIGTIIAQFLFRIYRIFNTFFRFLYNLYSIFNRTISVDSR